MPFDIPSDTLPDANTPNIFRDVQMKMMVSTKLKGAQMPKGFIGWIIKRILDYLHMKPTDAIIATDMRQAAALDAAVAFGIWLEKTGQNPHSLEEVKAMFFQKAGKL